MCIIELKEFVAADGDSRTVETTTRCRRAVGSKLCNNVQRRTTSRFRPVVEDRLSKSDIAAADFITAEDQMARQSGDYRPRKQDNGDSAESSTDAIYTQTKMQEQIMLKHGRRRPGESARNEHTESTTRDGNGDYLAIDEPFKSHKIHSSRSDEDLSRLKALRAAQESEQEPQSFRVRSQPRKYFTIGKAFKVVWKQADGGSRSEIGPRIRTVRSGEMSIFKARRFVVIQEASNYCSAVPIISHSPRKVDEASIARRNHCLIHTGKTAPQPLPRELSGPREEGMCLEPIRVDLDDPQERLYPLSRLDFSKVYTIEHNIKVKNLGRVNPRSMSAFLDQFKDVWASRQHATLKEYDFNHLDPMENSRIPSFSEVGSDLKWKKAPSERHETRHLVLYNRNDPDDTLSSTPKLAAFEPQSEVQDARAERAHEYVAVTQKMGNWRSDDARMAPKSLSDEGYYSNSKSSQVVDADVNNDDIESIGTDNRVTEMTSVNKAKFAEIFADELVRSLESLSQESKEALKSSAWTLPDCLREFSLMIDHRARPGIEQRANVFIRHRRRDIANRFCNILLAKPTRNRDPDPSFQERIAQWRLDSSGDPDEITIPPDDQDLSNISGERDEDDKDALLPPEVTLARQFLTDGHEYSWLLHRLQRATETMRTGNTAMKVRNALSAIIGTNQAFGFIVDWNPVTFLQEQYGSYETTSIESVICISGSAKAVQADACGRYVTQTWPSCGAKVLEALAMAVKSNTGIYRGSNDVIEDVTICAISTIVIATGSFANMVEVGEILSWLGAACRSSALPNQAQYFTPSISSSTNSSARKCCRIQYTPSDLPASDLDSGDCWRNIFRNPSVAYGYPIDARANEEDGLEIDLALAADLSYAQYATTFLDMFLLKGFCSALVPTKMISSSVIWHYVLNKDLSHLTYNKAREYWNTRVNLDISCLKGLRHFIGWTKYSRIDVGTDRATYNDIDFTGKHLTSRGIGIKELQLGGSSYLSAAATVVPGKKDRRFTWSSEMPFQLQIHQASESPVVIFDVTDRRGWLLDGAALILLLVRAWVSHPDALPAKRGCAGQALKDFKHLDATKKKCASPYDVLIHKANQRLKISLETDDSEDEASVASSSGEVESNSWDFRQLVLFFYNVFEQMQAYRADVHQGQWDVDIQASKNLRGFCFMDILTMTKVVRSRSVPLASPAWLKMTEKVGSVNIIGRSFGQLISATASDCEGHTAVPRSMDVLVTQLTTLKDIARRNGKIHEDCIEIVKDKVYWNNLGEAFQTSTCSQAADPLVHQKCSAHITLLGSSRAKSFKNKRSKCIKIFDLYPEGAIIIGHHKRMWEKLQRSKVNEEPDQNEEQDPDEDQSQEQQSQGDRTSSFNDSGIGMSSSASSVASNPS